MDYFKIRLNRSHPIYTIKFILVPYMLVLTSPRAINKSEKKRSLLLKKAMPLRSGQAEWKQNVDAAPLSVPAWLIRSCGEGERGSVGHTCPHRETPHRRDSRRSPGCDSPPHRTIAARREEADRTKTEWQSKNPRLHNLNIYLEPKISFGLKNN